MPVYDFYCKKCGFTKEFKLSFKEKETFFSLCPKCKLLMTQKVAPLRFKLKGGGWFDQDYGITQQEMNKNLEEEKRIEEQAYNYDAKQ